MQLNSEQASAVKYIEGPLLVLAGAGSGKTRVITEKISYLLGECGYNAQSVFAVTFTNKAAREMQSRTKLIAKKKSKGLNISTFHTLGLKLLHRSPKAVGLKSNFSILDENDVKSILSDIMQRRHEDDQISVEDVQHKVSLLKNALCPPKQALNNADNAKSIQIATIFDKYCHTLKAYNSVDFDDLIFLPVQMLKQNEQILSYWQNRIRYLLVDEYQDTNHGQYELLKLLTGINSRFTLVGDDDQSIYAWRGARPENINELSNDYPGLKVIKLEQNYRSTARILKAANKLILNNPHIITKKLWSDFGMGEAIKIIKCKNEESEAERVATDILVHRLRYGTRLNHYAILYRSNYQARLIELKLQEHQIPYHISGGTSFFGRTEVKDLISYLKLLVNSDDNNAFLRVINTPRREIGISTIEKLNAHAEQKNLSLYDACSCSDLYISIDKRYLEKLRTFVSWFDKIKEKCERESPDKACRDMVNEMEYREWLQCNNNTKTAERKVANVEFLLDSVTKLVKNNDETDSGEEQLKQAVFKLTLQDILERQESEEDCDRVQLLTLHAAKGLEFPYVYIIGVEEEVLPHRNSVEDQHIQEERRLAYVGITRAQQHLTLTMASERKMFGEKNTTSPSRFIMELPQEDLIMEGFDEEVCHEKKKVTGNSMLSLLHESLDS